MYYNSIKNIYRFSTALVLGLCFAIPVQAQGVVSLGVENSAPAGENNNANPLGVTNNDPSKIPNEIALFESNTDIGLPQPNNNGGLLTPGGNPTQAPNSAQVPVINNLDNNPLAAKGLPNQPAARNGLPQLPNQALPGATPQNNRPFPPAAVGNAAASENNGGLPKVGDNPLFPAAQQTVPQNIIEELDDEVFSQMSDIEKQTALLTLELRREKIKNEIDAIKVQRQKAIEEQKNMEAERELKRLEWEKEQERKIIDEQIKLKKIEFAYEKLRQENLLNEYKEQMLKEEQKWIKTNMEIYAQVAKAKEERDNWTTKYRDRLTKLVGTSDSTLQEVQGYIDNQKREISDLQTQVSILKARLEAQQKMNPFGQEGSDGSQGQGGSAGIGGAVSATRTPSKPSIKLSDMYVIMEISGQGDELIAKMMNREGQKFLAKVGTKFKTGDVVDEITSTYIRTENEGEQDYLYFSAGGVLEEEQENKAAKKALAVMSAGEKQSANTKGSPRGLITSNGVPGVSRDMMLR